MGPRDNPNGAERRQEEQSQEAEICHINLWNEIQLKRAIKRETDTKPKEKKWVSSVGLYFKNIYYKNLSFSM